MEFELTPRCQEMRAELISFMDEFVYPNEETFDEQLDTQGTRWQTPQIVDDLKAEAKKRGLWNLFLPDDHHGAGLTNVEYAPLCEIMGRVDWAPEVFNCNAPDTGNMEVLHMYGTPAQQEEWLTPLLNGEIRSAFAMTEPDVASSDATNIECSITRDGDEYVVNGRKWWTSNAGNPRCKIMIVMGKTDPTAARHEQQSQILVPTETPGVTIERMLNVMGYDDAPHGHAEVSFDNVRVPTENLVLGEGRGFEVAQGRLGPGRIHHCMRVIGVAERALEAMCKRAAERETWGKLLAERGITEERIAQSRIEIEMCRLLVMKAAWMMDTVGNKEARQEIAMIKVAAPNMALGVIDRALQLHGGGGMSDDFPLAAMYARTRAMRLFDGPDEVHRRQIARLELRRQIDDWPRNRGVA
ncbi:MAG: acyl-CoA dehydrogenase [Rhodospirillaceae bacterium]|jgi:acyl-CoA dehydrogenase|nr:acyl-CoA dehydrogenase [Rhodospirillaceae bacterium]MBT3810203.1 acyl-CoA dehydrogenase [Rhodospirillaceae bacterium]MBT3931327.1 acyl-CoA dehydrogenase [Rhodospirillaceae bacterium]MBT4772216.1 acyl-CoA dehydrogenase [Rhodospirillaceae bacterium]MBT5359503.1 acyl-CoA dehydrogenase [Rhodospirillaceae bacterium]